MQKKNKNITTFFYSNAIDDNSIILEGDEFIHCIKTLRNSVGNSIEVLDGIGSEYECKIVSVLKDSLVAEITNINRNQNQTNFLCLGISPTKSLDRFEWLVEKAVELGVAQIVPIITNKTEKSNINLNRLSRISIAALKQSGNLFLPKIMEPLRFSDYLKLDLMEYESKLIAHCNNAEIPNININNFKQKTIILIGPEGDFTLQEVNLAKEKGFEEILLGKQRMRTETAALFVCGLYHYSTF